MLRKERNAEVALAALGVLRARPAPELRPALFRAYEHRDAEGSKRDQGGAVRAAILHALRPVARPEDAPLLLRAAATYEFLFGEAASDLRAAGLLVLNEVDEVLAGYRAVLLLTDPYTDVMSGEPAVTAVRVLASQELLPPLYAYLLEKGERRAVADVVAECLRSLGALPPALLPPLLERYGESGDEIVLLGLFDLLLGREDRAAHLAFVEQFLRDTHLPNIYRSVVSTLVASREEPVLALVERLAEEEKDRRKAEVLREALALT